MAYYKLFPQLFIDYNTNLISIYTKNTRKTQEQKEQDLTFFQKQEFVNHLNSFMLHLINYIHMDTLEQKYLQDHLARIILFLMYINGFQYSFMIV